MNIGIDIDGVLTNDDQYTLEYMAKYAYLNKKYEVNDFNNFEFNKMFWDKETIRNYRESEYFDNYFKNERPRHFASEVIKILKERNNNIYIITSRYRTTEFSPRGKEIRDLTIKWLNENKIVYDKIIFSNDKTKEIKKYKLDIIIEDSPETVPIFSKYTKVFLFDARYNKNINGKNITRVYSWYDILKNIEEVV